MALDAGLRAQYCGLRHLRAYESARGLQGAPRQSNAPLSPHEGKRHVPTMFFNQRRGAVALLDAIL